MRISGTSVSIAWDAKQAVDLLAIVRPEIVIVDLGLRGAHMLVVEAASARSEPLVVLIPTGAGDEAAFAKMARPLLAGRRAVPRDAIIARAWTEIRRATSSKIGMLERARDLL
jgi:DNA-binding NtrC family response regulator